MTCMQIIRRVNRGEGLLSTWHVWWVKFSSSFSRILRVSSPALAIHPSSLMIAAHKSLSHALNRARFKLWVHCFKQLIIWHDIGVLDIAFMRPNAAVSAMILPCCIIVLPKGALTFSHSRKPSEVDSQVAHTLFPTSTSYCPNLNGWNYFNYKFYYL